jgi:hypothetical protein
MNTPTLIDLIEAAREVDLNFNNGNEFMNLAASMSAERVHSRLAPALICAVDALERIDLTLRVPAAEYVPAISDAFTEIDRAKARIREMLEGKEPKV